MNITCDIITFQISQVLIETLWNVNEHSDRKEWHKRVCINRNIVECKSGTGAVSAMPYAY